MARRLTRDDVQRLLAQLEESITRPECRTCDCLQGYLTQLELDADDDVSDLTVPLKVARDRLHGCLGCDPCPPAVLYSCHLRRQKDE